MAALSVHRASGGAAKQAMQRLSAWVCRRAFVLWVVCGHADSTWRALKQRQVGRSNPYPGVVVFVLLSLAGGMQVSHQNMVAPVPNSASLVPPVSTFRNSKVVKCKKYTQAQKWCRYNLFVLREKMPDVFAHLCLGDAFSKGMNDMLGAATCATGNAPGHMNPAADP